MPINFNDERNKFTYTGRTADESWTKAILSLDDPNGLQIADVGCGGGIYSRAWLALGAREVIGVDSSPNMISVAEENCSDLSSVSFLIGDATNTGLTKNSVDVVFERALIHHLADIHSCLQESMRILKPGGTIIIQDRTPDDISFPGSHEHIRGYFFECFPQLLDVESGRRRTDEEVLNELAVVGFEYADSITVWETRRVHPSKGELLEEIRQRKGRSILHELNDSEIESLVSFIEERLNDFSELVEKDRWTIWHATKLR
jgi:ubiquinone/menaquinone biosynthesis C-methylase UbiE